jgi:hypothetical protein
MNINRRRFIRTLALSPIAYFIPPLLFSQESEIKTAKKNPKTMLEYILADPNINDDEKKGYKNLNTIMNSAIKYQGNPLSIHTFHFDLDNEDCAIRVQTEHKNGKLRFIIYFPNEKEWYNSRSFMDLHLYWFSENETKLSLKTYEINLNQHNGFVSYWDIRERRLEGEEIIDKIEKSMYTVTKKLFKIKKKDMKEIVWMTDYLKDMINYERKQELTQIGNLITGNHVYIRDLYYNAFASFLWQADKGARAVKFIEFEIARGEASCSCFGIAARAVKFKGQRRIISRPEGFFVPFNLEKLTTKPKH